MRWQAANHSSGFNSSTRCRRTALGMTLASAPLVPHVRSVTAARMPRARSAANPRTRESRDHGSRGDSCHHREVGLAVRLGDEGMGYFGTFLFVGQSWMEAGADEIVAPDADFWLHVDIHDSDIATITYRPTGIGSGVTYLGYTPARTSRIRPRRPRRICRPGRMSTTLRSSSK